MVNRCILYKSSYCQEWFFDLDIAMLQLCCVAEGPRPFIVRALNVFGLERILQVFRNSDSTADSASSGRSTASATTTTTREASQDIFKFFAHDEYDFMIVQGFLRMLVYISAERVRIGYTDMERLRRKLIHRLCVGDQTHSSLLKTIPRRLSSSFDDDEAGISIMGDEDFVSGGSGTDKHYRMFEECLHEVAIFQHPKEMDQGHYRLRDELWQEYDPFYPHYQSRERAVAEERHIQFRRKHQLFPHRLIFPQKSPKSLPLIESFSSLLDLCRELCRPGGLVCSVLSRCLAFCRQGKDLDGTLNSALYLIYIALETSNDSEFKASLMRRASFMHPVLLCTNEQDEKVYIHETSLAFLLQCVEKCSSCTDQHEAAKFLLSLIQTRDTPSSSASQMESSSSSSTTTRETKRKEMRRRQQEALEKMRKQQEAFLKKQHSLFKKEVEEKEEAASATAVTSSKDENTNLEEQENICSLCHEVAVVKNLVVVGFIQRSSIPMLARRVVSMYSSERRYHSPHQSQSPQHHHRSSSTPNLHVVDRFSTNESSSTAATELFAWEQMYDVGRQRVGDEEYLDHDDIQEENDSDILLSEEEMEDDTQGEEEEEEEWFAPSGQVDRMLVTGGEEWNEDVSVDHSAASFLTVGTDWSQLTRTDSSSVRTAFQDEDIQKGLDTRPDTLFQSCGHQMHWSCFERYFTWLTSCHAQRLPFDGETLIDVTHGEFLCPVCRRMANIVIPVMEEESALFSYPGRNNNTSNNRETNLFPYLSLHQLEQVYRQQCHRVSQIDAAESLSCTTSENQSDEDSLIDVVLKSLCFDQLSSDRSHVPFPSSASVPSNLRRRSVEKSPSVMSKGLANLLSCLIYTVMTQEVAARSGYETMHSFIRELHSIVILLRKCILTHYAPYCKSEFRRLWMTYLEPPSMNNSTSHERQPAIESVDAFSLFAYAVMLWPDNWNQEVLSLLLRLCFLLHFRCSHLLMSHGDSGFLHWTTNAVVFVRRCVVFLHCIFGSTTYPCAIGVLSETQGLLPSSQDLSMAYSLGLIARDASAAHEGPQDSHNCPLVKDFVQKWQSILRTAKRDWRYPLRPLTLISLPKVFQDLVETLEGKACKRCHGVSKKQTLCLICGDLLCMSEGCSSYPFERSVTQFAEFETMRVHAHECAAGIGIFLLLKATWVLLIRNNRTAIWGSPYLDEFGEEDMELHRGKPLYLNQERMQVLQRLFVTQGFDYDARILNKSTQFQYIALFR